MKKKTSVILFLLSVIIFLVHSFYTNGSFDYHIAQFIGYLFYWSITLFVFSILGLSIDNNKYKKYSIFSLSYALLSILMAYLAGDGSGAMVSFDGKDLTFIFAGLYTFISIVYFIVQYFKKR